mmetsp:Transcript_119647/g.186871  ORF Transcript_119647/g.186871 Transcript_119647/m.186871 type:complete len:80 (+) Transcript_119647:43-282(+)
MHPCQANSGADIIFNLSQPRFLSLSRVMDRVCHNRAIARVDVTLYSSQPRFLSLNRVMDRVREVDESSGLKKKSCMMYD